MAFMIASVSIVVGLSDAVATAAAAATVVVQPGMAITTTLSGLPGFPTAVEFAPDGRIYVAIKDGRVLMYHGPGDTTPVVTLDIRAAVNSYGDRGLLGIALDPAFTTGRPFLYALYTFDRDPFGNSTVPRWSDACPNPADGCTVTARLSRFTVDANGVASQSSLKVLLDGSPDPLDGSGDGLGGWCGQFDSHSIGTVRFGADGMLYAGAGDGASYATADYGQNGGAAPMTQTPANPCNDTQDTNPRSGGRGTALVAATSRGGALRSQSVRGALSNEYVSWDGAILRVDPDTGQAAAGNPLIGNTIAGDDRIVAYGLRNPFRFSFRPGTNNMWLGDVGYNKYEEINTFASGPTQASVPNFGWPCYEGTPRQGAYEALGTGQCTSLYTNNQSMLGGVASPYSAPVYTWARRDQGDFYAKELPCGTSNGGGAAVGGDFVKNPQWPAPLRGAYVFGDYARGCLMAMPLGSNGEPDPTGVTSLISGVTPVDIKVGPGGDIYWVDAVTKEVDRLRPIIGNLPPVASFTATPSNGNLPLLVQFDASATTDPNPGEVLTYTWDLNGDGICDDGSGITISRSYSVAAIVAVKLCVSDLLATGSTTRTIQPGNSPPVIRSLVTSADDTWTVGQTVSYSATAVDNEGTLPASAYSWTLILRHCDREGDAACHTHQLQDLPNGMSGTLVTPDHDYYAFLQLTLTVTDSLGLSTSQTVDLKPRISNVTVQTDPPGITVSAGGRAGVSALTVPFLQGGVLQMIAPRVATVDGVAYTFVGWADSPREPNIRTTTTPAQNTTYTARYVAARLTSVDPVRLLDTRTGHGAPQGRLAAGGSLRLQVTGAGGAPAGTSAAVLNLTAVDAVADGYVTAYPCGAIPTVSNLNVRAGDTAANLVTVPLDAQGGVCFAAQNATDLVVDLAAVVTTTGDGYIGVVPHRVVDTRIGTGLQPRALNVGEIVAIPLDAANVPANATAVMANVTVTNPTRAGYLTAFPCGELAPLASNLNYGVGQTVSNLVLTSLGSLHQLCITTNAPVDIVVDVSGWLARSGSSPLLITPSRVLDTRDNGARLSAGQTVRLGAVALGGPIGATAMIANVTAVDTVAAGFVTVYPCGGDRPLASNVNYDAAQSRPVLVVAALGTGRDVCIYTSNPIDLVVDLQGWMITDN